jgi:hypothetical protein
MTCSVEGGEELGRPGRRRCDRPWWERRRLEVEGGADRWDLIVSDWGEGGRGGLPVG